MIKSTEVKLMPDGTLAGPDKSKEGREFYYVAFFTPTKMEDLAPFVFEANWVRSFRALATISKIFHNVHTQVTDFTHEKHGKGYLYVVIGEIDENATRSD